MSSKLTVTAASAGSSANATTTEEEMQAVLALVQLMLLPTLAQQVQVMLVAGLLL